MGIVASLLNWLACHLVAIVFAAFALVAVSFQDVLWGQEQGQVSTPVQSMAKTGDLVPVPDDRSPTANPPPKAEVHWPAKTSEDRQAVQAPGFVFRPLNADVATKAPATDIQGQRFRTLEKPAEDIPRASLPDLLEQARAAFRRNDYAQAESLYLDYLKSNPADAVGFAELGDLYRATQRADDALDAFYEAGIRFQKQGAWRQLARIQRILAESGDPRAREFAGR